MAERSITKRRKRWLAFRARYDEAAPLDDLQFRELVDLILSEPEAVLQRSFVVHLGKLEREVVSDDQLIELGKMFTGKVPEYIGNALLLRRLRRDPRDQEAIRAALASKRAFVREAAAACQLTDEQRASLASR